jgi:hypothetical protein
MSFWEYSSRPNPFGRCYEEYFQKAQALLTPPWAGQYSYGQCEESQGVYLIFVKTCINFFSVFGGAVIKALPNICSNNRGLWEMPADFINS